ncbi:aminotransferase class III-fold pyridoxal phosphate-dependent enzyme [Chromobacterium haemolyticum]|nr:aminotransferase class III-fold pyridoxal phosphate-dependent enzyme [Chromobacterium haemolyticum]
MALRHGVDFDKAQALHRQELAMFSERRPRSRQLSAGGGEHLLFGAPLHWMADWSTPFNLYVEEARGARLRDVDGHEYLDFCLGDTGAMFGHSPEPVARAIADQAARGLTAMLPSPDAVWVAEELARRFGLSHWQFALSASDANRFALRWLRAASGRDRIIVFNGCYHGTVDDAFVDLIDRRPAKAASQFAGADA